MLPDVTSIRQYREQLGLTQQALGDRVGVTRQTIAAWERGERDVGVVQLVRLARALAVPVELLLGGDVQPGPKLMFRADDPTVLSEGLRRLLHERAEAYAAIERLAGELPVLPESRPLDAFLPDQLEVIAREIRAWFGVDGAPLGDVLALFEGKGLKVLRHRLPTEVSGFSAFTESWGGVVVVNDGHPLERQYFTALHELAHLVFHRSEYDGPVQTSNRRSDPREKVANHFASAVLLPREVMERELRGWRLRWIPEPVLIDMKLRYRVSMRTVLFRAGALGLISRRQAGQQVGVLNRRFGPHHEQPELPKPERGPLGRLEWLTYRALVNEAITTSRAAEVLAMPLAEVRARLAAYMRDPAMEGAAA